jgi:hypothetical protein
MWVAEDIDELRGRFYRPGLFEPPDVHHAAGMIMAQLEVDAHVALARLRSRAAVADQPVISIA